MGCCSKRREPSLRHSPGTSVPRSAARFSAPRKENALVIIEMAFRRQVGSSKLAHHCIAGGAGIKQCCFHFLSFLMYVQLLRIPEAIPHNSKCRYGERGAADAKPKAQIILDAAKVSAASGGNSEPKQGQRSQSARGFCPRSTMRVPQPDIIEHFGNADAVPQLPERCLSR